MKDDQAQRPLRFSSRTDVGRARPHNEDSIGDPGLFELLANPKRVAERGFLFAIADGMGGHARGEVASRLAVEALFTSYYTSPGSADPSEMLRHAFAAANAAVFRAGHLVDPELAGPDSSNPDVQLARMGTTLVAAAVLRHTVFIGNVGDSRAYVLDGGRLEQISADHSLVAEEVRQGLIRPEEARSVPLRNVITRALGARETVEADFYWRSWPPEGRLLLCSDGLHGLVGDDVIESALKELAPEECARHLIEAANEAGGPDNVSVIVVAA
jgi:serine/threonine protein phosphatase PrpC